MRSPGARIWTAGFLLVLVGCSSSGGSARPEPAGSTAAVSPTTSPSATSTTGASTAPADPSTTAVEPRSTALGDPADCPLGSLEQASKPVQITLWYFWTGGRGDVTKALVDEFNASQDEVVVNAEFQGGPLNTEVIDKYSRSLDDGSAPDVVSDAGANSQSYLDLDSTVPVGACVAAAGDDLSDMLPAALATGVDGDTLEAMPWGSGGQVLYYNRAAFTAAGLDPDKPPTTLAEVRAASQAIMASGAAKHGLSILASTIVMSGLFGRSGEPWATDESGLGRADHSNGGGPFGVALMTELQQMVDSGELIAFPSSDPNPDDLLSVATGDSAMAIAAAGGLGDVIAALDAGVGPGVELGVAPAPSFGDKVSVQLEGSGAPFWLNRGDDPAKLEAAYRFVAWMTAPAQIAEWVVKTGSIAIRTTAFDEPSLQQYWAANPLFRVATDQVADPDKPVVAGNARVGTAAVAAEFDDAAAAILIDGADPVERLTEASKTADAAIADYNARSSSTG